MFSIAGCAQPGGLGSKSGKFSLFCVYRSLTCQFDLLLSVLKQGVDAFRAASLVSGQIGESVRGYLNEFYFTEQCV